MPLFLLPVAFCRCKTSLPLSWSWAELVPEDWFSVDTAAANVDGDVPDVTDPPVVQVPLKHRLGVTHQHLGLHLLAIIIF